MWCEDIRGREKEGLKKRGVVKGLEVRKKESVEDGSKIVVLAAGLEDTRHKTKDVILWREKDKKRKKKGKKKT